MSCKHCGVNARVASEMERHAMNVAPLAAEVDRLRVELVAANARAERAEWASRNVVEVWKQRAETAERLRAFDTGTTPLPKGLMLEHARLDALWQELVRERDALRVELDETKRFLKTVTLERDHLQQVEVPDALDRAATYREEREASRDDYQKALAGWDAARRELEKVCAERASDRQGRERDRLRAETAERELDALRAELADLKNAFEMTATEGEEVQASLRTELAEARALIIDFYDAYCDRDDGHKHDFSHPAWAHWDKTLTRFLEFAKALKGKP